MILINHRKSLQNCALITILNNLILRSRVYSFPLLLIRPIQTDSVPLLHKFNLLRDAIPAKTVPIDAQPYVNVQNRSNFTIQLITLNYAPNSQNSHHHDNRALFPSHR